MTTTTAGLLRAILEHPEDDALRMVYADWLDDHDQPERAEFIRLQCELSRINPGPDEHAKASRLLSRYHKGAPVCMRARAPATLLMRESILLDECGEKWFRADRGMDPFCPVERNAWMFRPLRSMTPFSYWLGYARGLLGRFDGTLSEWLAHGAALTIAAPVEAVVLVGKEPEGYPAAGNLPREWSWWGTATHLHFDLPAELFDRLEGGRRNGNEVAYLSREAALAALSAACLALARQQVGLPPLACHGTASSSYIE
jgi:uncharacterized protein (TIGR02996 family)